MRRVLRLGALAAVAGIVAAAVVGSMARDRLAPVADVAEEVVARKESLRGFRIVEQALHLRHFTAKLEPLAPARV